MHPRRPEDDDSGVLEGLVTTLLSVPEREFQGTLDRLCLDHPKQAEGLRRKIAILRTYGLLDRSTGEHSSHVEPMNFGGYTLLEPLGRGGMGAVHRARTEEGTVVALKFLAEERLYVDGALERFEREIRAVAKLSHPSIIRIFDVGREGFLPYYTMNLVEGASLSQVIKGLAGKNPDRLKGSDFAAAIQGVASSTRAAGARVQGAPLPEAFQGSWAQACYAVLGQVAAALQHAHEHGVLHRDVKPSNILVTPEGQAVLIDFGLAYLTGATRLTRTGTPLGSFPYMAPEKWLGQEDCEEVLADVYSLGTTLYECLTLRDAFDGKTAQVLRQQIVEGAVLRPRRVNRSLTTGEENVCRLAMAREPKHRYRSAGHLAQDMQRVAGGSPVEARVPGLRWAVRTFWRQHPSIAAALVVLAICTSIGFAIIAWQQMAARRGVEVALERASRAESRARGAARVAEERRVTTKHVLDGLEEYLELLVEEMGRGREPREAFRYGLDRVSVTLEAEPTVRARLQRIIGSNMEQVGDYHGAKAILERSLASFESGSDTQPMAHGETLRALANVQLTLGELDGAYAAITRALAEHERAGAEAREHVGGDYVMLARIEKARGQLSRAAQAARRAQDLALAELGPDHPDVAIVLDLRADVALAQGQVEEARTFLHRALEILEAQEIPRGLVLAPCYERLGILSARGPSPDLEVAEAYLRRALAVYREHQVFRRTNQVSALIALARVLRRTGDVSAALVTLHEGLRLCLHAFGADHDSVATLHRHLGMTYYQARRYADAQLHFEWSSAILAESPDGSAQTATAEQATDHYYLGATYKGKADLACAQEHFQRATDIYAALERGRWTHGDALSALGEVLHLRGITGEPTRAHLERGHAILRRTLGEEHSRTKLAAARLKALPALQAR